VNPETSTTGDADDVVIIPANRQADVRDAGEINNRASNGFATR
jgi:hypothetical protein